MYNKKIVNINHIFCYEVKKLDLSVVVFLENLISIIQNIFIYAFKFLKIYRGRITEKQCFQIIVSKVWTTSIYAT